MIHDISPKDIFAAEPSQMASEYDAKILLVDDKEELLNSLHQLVTLHGYDADKALGGEAAMAAMADNAYDLILLDLIMPGISGHDILDFAARQNLQCKIIVVSGDSSFSGVKHALHCGAFDFVKKPYEAAELIATMETALRQVRLEHEHAHMEDQVKKSEELHRFIVDSSPDLVYMLDRNGCFTFINERVTDLLGYERSELIGRHYTELIDDDDLEKAHNLFNERRGGDRAIKNTEIRLRSRTPGRHVHSASIWAELTAMGVYADNTERTRANFVGTYGTARDISARKQAEEVINFQAYHDLLTHLPNRALLKDRLSLAITHAQRNKRKLAAMFLDLDRFKLVNDTLGHNMGDRLLKAVANRLQSCLRSGDTLSRFGGDEFTLLLPEVRTRDDVVVIAEKILDRLNEPFVIDGHELFVGVSIGIAMYPEGGETGEDLVQNADIAMYHVKSRGKNGYQFFSDEMNHQFSTRLNLERELRNALLKNEIEVHYQPQISLADGHVTGVEALVRWRHGHRGIVEPREFLPLAEETGLITQIDEYVQKRAFSEVAEWHRAGYDEITLSVNLTATQIEQDNFVAAFKASLDESGLNPTHVKIELTENSIMRDVEVIIPRLKEVRAIGVQIAIDDFGTGYSSLSYLQQFPINTLKIDRSFVGDIRADHAGASLVDAIMAMARGLHLDTIAEGVENRTQLQYLRSHGCEVIQGFLVSPAVPATDLVHMLKSNEFPQLIQRPQAALTA